MNRRHNRFLRRKPAVRFFSPVALCSLDLLQHTRIPEDPALRPVSALLSRDMCCAKAIVLASLILMRQARMSKRSEERDHLMLQIMMLSEKEITTVLRMDRQIAGEMGLQRTANKRGSGGFEPAHFDRGCCTGH